LRVNEAGILEKLNTDQLRSNYFLITVLEKNTWVTKIAYSCVGSLHITAKIKREAKKERPSGLSHASAKDGFTEKDLIPPPFYPSFI